jgi:hypothetical protein
MTERTLLGARRARITTPALAKGRFVVVRATPVPEFLRHVLA